MKKKVLFIFGTRPEAIKMAPVLQKFKENKQFFKVKLCVTAQHRKILDQVLDFFEIKADYDLNLMKSRQNLYTLSSEIIKSLKTVLEDFCPEYVFVHGDTTTTMAASIASFYSGAKICHVEAGLRTNNKQSPFPEEINRQITSRLCDYHFAPTPKSKTNLIKENISEESILITGNTVIDALLKSVKKVNDNKSSFVKSISKRISDKEVILVTGHRRENHGKGFIRICEALKIIANNNKDKIIIYPVHPNPMVQEPVNNILSNIDNIILLEPLDYKDFIWLMNRSKLIITDSGGVQEEAPSLGKPVIVLRDTTERPEAVEAGTVILVGTNKKLIISKTQDLLNNKNKYEKMSRLHNPYGDGTASKKIVEFIKNLK